MRRSAGFPFGQPCPHRWTAVTVLLLVLVWPTGGNPAPAADACPRQAVERLVTAGDYDEAVARAEKSPCAPALALAARALLAEGAFLPPGEKRSRILDRAIALAERALAKDPENLTALLQAAAAYGFRAVTSRRIADVRRAWALLARGRELAPKDPYVLAAIATWHARTRLGAGGLLAPVFFGATKGAARRFFSAALDEAPDAPAIVIGAGLLLVAFGGEDMRTGLALLRRARALPSRDAFTRILKERATALLAAAEEGLEGRALRRLARRLQPYAQDPLPGPNRPETGSGR